jgi:hypothetical protein
VILSVVYLLARCLLGRLMERARRARFPKTPSCWSCGMRTRCCVGIGRVRYQPGGRLLLAALAG